MTPLLPAPEMADWLPADVIAHVLEALAAELYLEAGPRPEGWRNRARRQRWLGQHQVVNRIRYRAIRYRIRQLDLKSEATS